MRHQRHPLVMGHVALHDRDRRALGQPARACSRAPRGTRTGPRRPGVASRAKFRTAASGSIIAASAVAYGAIDEVLAEAALEAEAGHAEARVLVGLLEVAGVERRLGDAPRHAAARRRSASGGPRPAGRSARAGCRPVRASRAPASGTRTSTRTTRSAPSRGRPASAPGRAGTSGPGSTSPLAIARKLVRRASEASRS